jgi:acetyltransferase-like isoleucine patch superfamily enzyme
MAARQTPWKAMNELRRLLWLPTIRAYFLWHGIGWGNDWRIYGLPVIQRHRGSRIAIGSSFEMRNWLTSNPLGIVRPSILATWSPGARIEIGHRVGISGVVICAQTEVRIGDDVLIGANTTIADTDFHPLDAAAVGPGASAPVVVEDGVFIGMHTLVLKGSRIGARSVIGAGSVVAGDIPPGVVAAGNPARVIRETDREVAATPRR